MNLLFLLRSLDVGGVEVVTAELANKFVSEGHNVSVFVFEKGRGKILNRFSKTIQVTTSNIYKKTNYNVSLLRNVLIFNKIDIVINQWGLPLIPIKTLLAAKKN